jgi:alkanesulfonate monooxygenase SsuD/methylene tetrahydromethanopterin reductase-like flavin-dependent oxidoreductase (luciferase family)
MGDRAHPVRERHDRFHEAHDLILRAWTETGPFAFEGKHYQFEYFNLWPRPYQSPRPPIWIPSQGSSETIEWASHPDRRYTYLQTFTPVAMPAKYMQMYEATAAGHGYEALRISSVGRCRSTSRRPTRSRAARRSLTSKVS